jgi:hypothetical protein
MVENEQTLMISPTRRSTRRRQVDAADTVRRDDVAALTKAKPMGERTMLDSMTCNRRKNTYYTYVDTKLSDIYIC